MTTKPNTVERCSPTCAHPAVYLVQDSAELHPAQLACLVHLGTLVASFVGRYGTVCVERVVTER